MRTLHDSHKNNVCNVCISQKNKHIENEKKRKQEHEDAKLAQRLQADEDNRTTTPHLRDTVR